MSKKTARENVDAIVKDAEKHLSHGLSERELAILASGMLDLALVGSLERRLVKHEEEVDKLLGLNSNAEAPIGSFGARTTLAVLLGIIKKRDAKALNAVRSIRNRFAHAVEANLLDPDNLKQLHKLHAFWKSVFEPEEYHVLIPPPRTWDNYDKDPKTAKELFVYACSMLLSVCNASMWDMKRIEPLDSVGGS